MSDVTDKVEEAKLALLERIVKAAGAPGEGPAIALRLAEAYAWLTAPANAHG